MGTRTQLLERIADFLARHKLSERQFGLEAVGDHRLVPRLRQGAGVTLTSIDRAEKYMEKLDKAAQSGNGEAA